MDGCIGQRRCYRLYIHGLPKGFRYCYTQPINKMQADNFYDKIILWFTSFLKGRQQKVTVHDMDSEWA